MGSDDERSIWVNFLKTRVFKEFFKLLFINT